MLGRGVIGVIGYSHCPSSKVIREGLKNHHKPCYVKTWPTLYPAEPAYCGNELGDSGQTGKRQNFQNFVGHGYGFGFGFYAVLSGRVYNQSRRNYNQICILRLNCFLCGAEWLGKKIKPEMGSSDMAATGGVRPEAKRS